MLVCSIVHRTNQLANLLAALAPQIVPGVGVRVFRDNLETGYGEKCQALLDSSTADYVSFVDDDDMVAPDFVARVLDALAGSPDYVGFRVLYTVDGLFRLPVIHSLRFPDWINTPDELQRDLVHFNPIRRDLALLGEWEGGMGADFRWATQVRATGRVRDEAFIDAEMYRYQHVTADSFLAHREPLTEHPPRPECAFATWL